jgi:hypothetical protein
MTLGSVYTIVGFRIGATELLAKLLELDAEFREMIKERYIGDDFTFEEFSNFVIDYDPETVPEDGSKEECMLDRMLDIEGIELGDQICPGTPFKAYQLTHDVDESRDYIVGESILTEVGGEELNVSLDELAQRVDSAKTKLAEAGITEYRLYAVQDDCTCCS